MTTIASVESLPRRSETKIEDFRTPTLDLFDALTLAEEIGPETSGQEAKAIAAQIMKCCDREDMAGIADLARKIKEAPNRADMRQLAASIVEEAREMLTAREAEVIQVEVA